MALPQSESKLRLPASLQLLLTPGMRTHTAIFTILTLFLLVAGFVGKAAAFGQTWTVIFVAGASLALTYLVIAPATLREETRNYLLRSRPQTRIIIVSAVYGTILAGLALWTLQAGSVEALPIFPVFLAIFYAWILLQAYFVAAPVTHALEKIEDKLSGESLAKKIIRTLGVGVLILPIIPLAYGVWLIGTWVGGSSPGVQLWAVGMILGMLITLFLTISWTWPSIRRGRPQTAVFVGGTYGVVWAYLLYRSTSILFSYLSQGQGGNAVVDIGLMTISIFGAMHTFTRKTMKDPDRKWIQTFPFLVFSFGSIYAVSQLYFIVQVPITRADLSIIVNATIFVSGLATMMLLIKRHVFAASPQLQVLKTGTPTSQPAPRKTGSASRLSLLLGKLKPKRDDTPSDDDY